MADVGHCALTESKAPPPKASNLGLRNMNIPSPAVRIPLAIMVGAFLLVSQQVLADNVGQLPATKHQTESIKGIKGTETPPAPATAAGLPITTHQSEALTEAHPAGSTDHGLLLTGDQEVPAIKTSASGKASITIGADKTVNGGISTSGIVATAAHIHAAAVGKNGPVVITLVKDGDHGWLVPADSSLTDAQYANFKAGELYVNVHSAAHGAGEMRAQLTP